MNEIERYKLEKKYVPLVDKYCIGLFFLGLILHYFLKIKALTYFLMLSFFLVKILVYVYTTQYSVAIKIKQNQELQLKKQLEKQEMDKVYNDLHPKNDVEEKIEEAIIITEKEEENEE